MKRVDPSKNNKNAHGSFSRFQVNEAMELMAFLMKSFPDKSRNSVKSLLTHRQVQVNEKIVTRYNALLKPGEVVSVNKGKGPAELKTPELKILFEDEYLIVIEKEAGLLSIATANEKEMTAYRILREYVKTAGSQHQIFVVHRLDRETSGVMMFAKSQVIQEKLQKNWQEMVLERSYIALVEGRVLKPEDTIKSWLQENSAFRIHSGNIPGQGQMAVTHYKLIKQSKQYSLLKVDLETGRKNQIRVHMQEIGHPVAGDKKYGAKTNPLKRLGLHANVLTFTHPVSSKVLKFESPIPRKFNQLV